MNLFLDENIDRQIVDRLRGDGHTVWYVAETSPSISDDEVLSSANSKKAALITSDKDFGELIFRQRLVSHGVILIRLSGLSLESKANIVSHAVAMYAAEMLGCFTVISKRQIRIRKIFPSGLDSDEVVFAD
ncbi:MAG: DUF5615 family PIN-like protein [Desulfobacterales bacterium]|nr:DUF5615 family PIN-like protein [Desulfobacterales bacterium]